MTARTGDVPELVAGDRLTRVEFERRYAAMPRLKKAELIEGVVYVPSPVRLTHHGQPQLHLSFWLSHYVAATPGLVGADNATVRLDLDNEPQPDLLLCIPEDRGGAARIDADGYLEGPPELVAEITASTASYDLHDKLRAYRRNGVREYLVWRVEDGMVDWFALRSGVYEQLSVAADGTHRSEAFPGLWLDTAALLRGDLAAVRARLDEGLETGVHRVFAERIAAGADRTP